jgi:uncharacterized protein (DUF697 family)
MRKEKGKEEAASLEPNPTVLEEPTVLESPAVIQDDRYTAATKLVDRYVLWSGAAGLIPLPLVDVTAVSGVQMQMVRRVAEVYGVKFSDNLGKSVLASLMGSVIPMTSGMGLASVLKSVPLFGTAVAMLSMPALSASATYIIGRVFINHFASGGTLLDFNPPDYREFIKEQREKFKEQREKLKSRLDARSVSAPVSASANGGQDKPASGSNT